MNEDCFEHSGYESYYGTPLEYTFAPHDIDLPDMDQGNWETLHPSQKRSSTLRSSPETPSEANPGSLQEQKLPTPGNDAESTQSFHTAAGEVQMVPTPPSTMKDNNLVERSDDIGGFHCENCHIDLWDAFEHRYVNTASLSFV